MKTPFFSSLYILFLLLVNCQTNPRPKTIIVDTPKESSRQISTVTTKDFAKMKIEGMTCAIGCAASIEKKLNRTTGIVSATVDFESKTALVAYDAEHQTHEGLIAIVESVGKAYSVSSIENTVNHSEK